MSLIKSLLIYLITLNLFLAGCAPVTPITDVSYQQRAATWQWSSENQLAFTTTPGGQLKSDQPYLTEVMDFYQKNHQRGSFEGANGVNIYYDIFKSPQEHAALIISPGNGEASIRYAELVYDLMKQNLGYSLYLINHRGQGFSERLSGDARSWDAVNKTNPKAIEAYQKAHVDDFQYFIEDLKKFIDTVVKPETHPKVFALGHSLGGLILTRYMEQYPNQLKKVVLSSPMYKYSGTVTDMASQKAATTFVKTGRGLDYIMGQESSYNPTIPFVEQGKINALTTSRNRFDLRKFIVQENPATALGGKTWGWMNETLKNTDLVKKYATKIRDSVLILQAADDQLIDLSGHQEVCTMINQNVEPTQTPLCKIIRFPNAQHELLMEKDEVRNRVLDEIVTYFSK